MLRIAAVVAVLAACAGSAQALTMRDTLSAWRDGSAMDRMQLAARFGKSFVSLSDGFTADYFLKCIDDVAAYGNAGQARIEDAMRECVAARIRRPDSDDE